MDAPRTRYKVVERGRRLEVVDTWNGDRPVRPVSEPDAPPRPRPDGAGAVQAVRAPRLDQRGSRILHTQRWYDAKAPRQIVVTEAGEAKLRGLRFVGFVALFIAAVFAFLFWPLLLVALFMLLSGGTRKALQTASTRFLDTLNQPLTDSSSG